MSGKAHPQPRFRESTFIRAVTISRATYVLALGKLVNSARKPIQIPVYLADSLFLPREVEENLEQLKLEQFSGVEITYGGRKNQRRVLMPEMLIHSPELFDEAIAACTLIAEDHAKAKKRNAPRLMANHLDRAIPDLSTLLEYQRVLDALWGFYGRACRSYT